jgi:hypothetical protein
MTSYPDGWTVRRAREAYGDGGLHEDYLDLEVSELRALLRLQ